jgi:dihydroorotase
MSAHRPVLIINAEIADPLTGRTERGSLAIEDGMIHGFGRAIDTPPEGALIIDARGRTLAPGLVDLRAFVGEPGAEHRETLCACRIPIRRWMTPLLSITLSAGRGIRRRSGCCPLQH